MTEPNNTSLSTQRLEDSYRRIEASVQPFLDYMKQPRWKRILLRKKFSPNQNY